LHLADKSTTVAISRGNWRLSEDHCLTWKWS